MESNSERFVKYLSNWKSLTPQIAMRIPLYGIFTYIFTSGAWGYISDSWDGGLDTTKMIISIIMIMIFSFPPIYAIIATFDSMGRDSKAYGYYRSEVSKVYPIIEVIIDEMGVKYSKRGSKRNWCRLVTFSEEYLIGAWSIRCLPFRSRKGTTYETVSIEIGPLKNDPESISKVKEMLDARLKPFDEKHYKSLWSR